VAPVLWCPLEAERLSRSASCAVTGRRLPVRAQGGVAAATHNARAEQLHSSPLAAASRCCLCRCCTRTGYPLRAALKSARDVVCWMLPPAASRPAPHNGGCLSSVRRSARAHPLPSAPSICRSTQRGLFSARRSRWHAAAGCCCNPHAAAALRIGEATTKETRVRATRRDAASPLCRASRSLHCPLPGGLCVLRMQHPMDAIENQAQTSRQGWDRCTCEGCGRSRAFRAPEHGLPRLPAALVSLIPLPARLLPKPACGPARQ
jgi:hypothetical protein